MNCQECKYNDTKVIESREVPNGQAVRRRRECEKCRARFTTYERVERPHIVVIKKDGTRELYSRQKVIEGVYHACQKTPVTTMQIEELVDRLEKSLYDQSDPEVPTSSIGEAVMEALYNLNEIAYVRFASVYKNFKSLESFEEALHVIKNKK
jgi:transcriptional repressor NrdR